MARRRHSLHYRRKLHWYVTGKRGWKDAGTERDVCVFRYSEGDVQAGHASLGETDMCVFHREDRRGKLHRIYLQTLRVSSATLRACLCVCVCCVFAADRETMCSLNNSAAFLPLLSPPPDPPNSPRTPCFFCMFFFFFFCARTLQERIVLLSGGAAGVRARWCRRGTARSRKDCPDAGSPSSKPSGSENRMSTNRRWPKNKSFVHTMKRRARLRVMPAGSCLPIGRLHQRLDTLI